VTWQKFIGTTMLLYGLINPIGVIPIYLNLVHETGEVKSQRSIAVASAAVACLLICATIFGQEILNFFNVGLDDFRIAGGLLALFIAFDMFQAHYGGFMQTFEERMEADLHSIAITPLAFPLLVGPAEMSIMITLSNDNAHAMDKVPLIGASALTTGLMALSLWVAGPIRRALGTTGINVATRVMALIVASVGINFIMTGLKNELPGLVTRGHGTSDALTCLTSFGNLELGFHGWRMMSVEHPGTVGREWQRFPLRSPVPGFSESVSPSEKRGGGEDHEARGRFRGSVVSEARHARDLPTHRLGRSVKNRSNPDV